MEDQVRHDQDQAERPQAFLLDLQLSPQIEKFSAAELTNLRSELLRGQLDSWQAADLTANFLAGHGYGASAENLRERSRAWRCRAARSTVSRLHSKASPTSSKRFVIWSPTNHA